MGNPNAWKNLWWATGAEHPLKGKKNFHSPEWRKKVSKANMGHPVSEETRKKISKTYKALGLRGEKSKLWKKDSKRKQTTRLRGMKVYIEWRYSMYIRDKFTCKECGQKGGKLALHHIKSVAKFPDLIMEKSNVITLCKKCHKKTDSYLKHEKKEEK